MKYVSYFENLNQVGLSHSSYLASSSIVVYLNSYFSKVAVAERPSPPITRGMSYSAIQSMVLASRASGCLFGHPNPKKAPLRTPNIFCEEFLKMSISSI